jgi:probable phosphoglycerate mutase
LAAIEDRDLVEWNYGKYEGRRTAEILREASRLDSSFATAVPDGESPADVGLRADRVNRTVCAPQTGNVLVFSSGHILRVLGARWLGLPPR